MPLQLLELARLKPRKDRHSHPGDTGRYGAGAIVRLLRRPKPRSAQDYRSLPPPTRRTGLDRLEARARRRAAMYGV